MRWRSRLPPFAVAVMALGAPRCLPAQDWLVLQGVAEGEFWATDSGSRLLTRNNGQPGVLGRVHLFAGVAPARSLLILALGGAGSGTAYGDAEHFELEAFTVRATISRALVLTAGKLPSPVGGFAPRRLSPTNPLIGEPDAYPTTYPLGVQVSGALAAFDYRLGVISLPPTHAGYVPTAQARPRIVVGGGVTPFIGVRVGATFTRGTYLSDSVTPTLPAGADWRDFRHQVLALDGRASRGYADIHAEWAYSWYDVPTVAGRMSGPAYYVELKYTWSPRFFTAARFQRNDYPFLRPRSPARWLAVPANFYAGEVGVGFRVGQRLLAKLSYTKDDWTDQLSGQAIAAQLSYQFDVMEWVRRKL